jgi:YD repeat-containing protein
MPLLAMSYDVENRLTQATSSLNGTDQFVYDPQGQRVAKSENGVWKVHFYGVDGNLGGVKQYPGTVTSATTTPIPTTVDIGDGAQQQQILGVNINVGWSVGVFNDGSDVDRAAAIIHELGHAFNFIVGLGGSRIRDDNRTIPDSVKVSEVNTALVKEKCF